MSRRLIRLTFLFLLCLSLPLLWAQLTQAQTSTPVPSAPGQPATPAPVFPLQPGTVEGNINDAAPSVRYSFDANADDSVSISMETTSGDLDPFLFLLRARRHRWSSATTTARAATATP